MIVGSWPPSSARARSLHSRASSNRPPRRGVLPQRAVGERELGPGAGVSLQQLDRRRERGTGAFALSPGAELHAEPEVRLAGADPVAVREEPLRGLLQHPDHVLAGDPSRPPAVPRRRDQQGRAVGPGRRELQRPEEVGGRPAGVERRRALPGERQEPPGGGHRVLRRRVAGRPREVDRDRVVVRERVGPIGRALAERGLRPPGGRDVALGPFAAGDLPVRHVADHRVGERELPLARDRRRALAHQAALHKRIERPGRGDRVPARHLGHRARPEGVADHRCDPDHRAALRRQQVDAGGHDGLDGVRHVARRRAAALGEHPHELPGEQRVPARAREQRIAGVAGHVSLEPLHQRPDLVVRQAGEPQDVGPLGPAGGLGPRGVPVEQVLARRAQHQHRGAGEGPHEVQGERGHRGFREVQVLDHDHQRRRPRRPPQEPFARAEQLLALRGRPLALPGEHQRAEPGPEPMAVGADRFDAVDGLLERRAGGVHRVLLPDPGERPGHLAERPEGRALPVRRAGAAQPDGLAQTVAELGDQAALADPGLPHHDHSARRARLRDRRPGRLEGPHLGGTPDERAPRPRPRAPPGPPRPATRGAVRPCPSR